MSTSPTFTDSLVAIFKTERLFFRAVEDNEADKKFIHTQIDIDPLVIVPFDPARIQPRSTKQSDEFVTAGLSKAVMAVIVCLQEETTDGKPTPIGLIVMGWGGISPTQVHNRDITLGIALATPYQGKGYGTEAINWALDWSFRFGAYHRVSLCALSFNDRAHKLYQRLGFVEEGRAREAHWHNRKWYDMVRYGMLENEWEVIRGLKTE